MRISVSLRTSYPADSGSEAAGWILEQTGAARDAGLDALYLGDHHSTGPSAAYFQNVALLGRLLAEWDDRPVGGLFLLPLWNPVLLAEQVGTLASMHGGRFILQTAIGDGVTQFAGMGVARVGRTKRFEAGFDIVRRLLAGEVVTDETGLFRIEGACIAPVPEVPVEYWIGATARAGIDRAARLADGWECNAHVVPREAEGQAAAYRGACADLGRDPGVVAIRRDVHVASDARIAAAFADRAVAAGYRGFRPDALIFGSVESVATQFRRYADMGYDEIIVRHFCDDQPAVLSSLQLLGDVRAALR